MFVYNSSRFSAKNTLNMLARKPVTTLCAPPTVWRMLIQERLADYRVTLREAVGAGEPLNPEVIERVKAAWNITKGGIHLAPPDMIPCGGWRSIPAIWSNLMSASPLRRHALRT